GSVMMSDTLCRTMSRSAPAMVTPPVNDSLIVQRSPKSRKATKIDSSVSAVRSFFRFRLPQTRERNFMRRVGELEWWSGGAAGASQKIARALRAAELGTLNLEL